SAQSCGTGLQFLFKKMRKMRSRLVCERQLFHSGPSIVIRRPTRGWSAAGRIRRGELVRIGTQEIEDRTPQFSWISLQVIKEISAKSIWVNMTFPSRDDGTRIRA